MVQDNNLPSDDGSDLEPREPYVKGRVWIFAPEEKLVEWENWLVQNSDFKFSVNNDISFVIRRDPLSDPRERSLIRVWGHGPEKKEWVELGVSEIELPQAEGVSRRYRYVINQDVTPPLVKEALNRFFAESKRKEPGLPDFSSLKANADHILTFTHVPGLSPVKFQGRKPPTDLDLPTEFSEQPCWQAMGADKAYREKLEYQGEGVTVVIVDAAPELNRVSLDLVDFFISLEEEGKPFEPEHGIEFLTINETRALNKVQPPEDRAAFTDPPANFAIDPADLEPYHGPLIASLIRELAPKARIVLVKAFNQDGETTGSLFKVAVNFVLALVGKDLILNNQPVKIIDDPQKLVFNFSLGIPISSLREEVDALYMLEECDKACKRGAVIAAAAGNGSYYQHPRNPEEPAAYGYFADAYFSNKPTTFDQVIAVSASPSDPNIREYAFYSNQGNLAAPDHYILMDTGDGSNPKFPRYVYWAGTSFTTPLVSGCAAILLSAGASPGQVKDCLWQGAQKPQSWREVPIINLQASLDNLLDPTPPKPSNWLTGYQRKGQTLLKELLNRLNKLRGGK